MWQYMGSQRVGHDLATEKQPPISNPQGFYGDQVDMSYVLTHGSVYDRWHLSPPNDAV